MPESANDGVPGDVPASTTDLSKPQAKPQAAPAPEAKAAPDIDATIAAINKAIKIQIGALGDTLRAEFGAKKEPAIQKEGKIDWDGFFSDPDATMGAFANKIRADVFNEVASAYRAERGQSDFWSGFYSENPHLREYEGIVKSMLSSKEAEWMKEGISVGDAYKRLSDMAEDVGGKLSRQKAEKSEATMMVDGLAYVSEPPRDSSQDKIRTITDIIRDRQKKFSRTR